MALEVLRSGSPDRHIVVLPIDRSAGREVRRTRREAKRARREQRRLRRELRQQLRRQSEDDRAWSLMMQPFGY